MDVRGLFVDRIQINHFHASRDGSDFMSNFAAAKQAGTS